MTRFDPATDPERIIRDLEQRMRNYPLRTVRLTGSENKLLGLFLLSRNVPLSEAALQRALADISSQLRELEKAGEQGGERSRQAAPPADFSCQVSVEERAELFGIFAEERKQ